MSKTPLSYTREGLSGASLEGSPSLTSTSAVNSIALSSVISMPRRFTLRIDGQRSLQCKKTTFTKSLFSSSGNFRPRMTGSGSIPGGVLSKSPVHKKSITNASPAGSADPFFDWFQEHHDFKVSASIQKAKPNVPPQ